MYNLSSVYSVKHRHKFRAYL